MDTPEIEKRDLLNFNNSFTEFNEHCSFLCDAISALLYEYKDNEPDEDTLMGASRQLSRLKYKAEALKNELDNMCGGL